MCTKQKYVFNKYINKRLLVNCGKCKECLQQKANARAVRIRNHNQNAHDLCLFVTLTYNNDSVPYIRSKDLFVTPFYEDVHEISIFRGKRAIDSISSLKLLPYCTEFPSLKRKKDCVGVIYWRDVQNFIKRLRINLKRKLKYEYKISYFAVGEYGSHTFRPHFHLLIFFPQGSFEKLQPLVASSWTFGDMSRENKRISIAIDASSYIASYVNKCASLPKILESPVIRQKHSHSLHFGVGADCFSLPSILENVERGNMSYRRQIVKDGKPDVAILPIPKYVISRYFPKFKGYSSFAPDEVLQLLYAPIKLWYRLGRCSERLTQLISCELLYSAEEYRKFVVRLRHCIDYYISVTGKTIYDYGIDYLRVWTARSSYVLRHQYDDVTDFADFYENAIDFVYNPSVSFSLRSDIAYEINPNARSFLLNNDKKLLEQFIFKENLKDINNFVLSSTDDEF